MMDSTPVLTNMSSKQAKYEALVDAYARDLYRYAYWLCRKPEMAEDLVQETFLRAWRALHSLRDDKSAKSWLFTILRREHARQYDRLTPEMVDDYDFDSQVDEAWADDEVLTMRSAINLLAQEYREPLLLQVLGGYSCQEIAGMLNITQGAVMTRVYRARKQLLAVFSEKDGQRKESGAK